MDRQTTRGPAPHELVKVFGEPVSVYGRSDALADGVLVDVTETAREAGFSIPVAVSRNVWDRLIALPEGYQGFQDEKGRLWDVVYMASVYARRNRNTDRFRYPVLVRAIRKDLRDSMAHPKTRWPICALGSGDAGEPVVTIMFPEDD